MRMYLIEGIFDENVSYTRDLLSLILIKKICYKNTKKVKICWSVK